MFNFFKGLLAVAVIGGFALPVQAQSEPLNLPQVDVIGEVENIDRLPGSGEVVSSQQLKQSVPFTGNEAIRRVNGVYIRDEDGLGLRPNISIRGVAGQRSEKLLVLEDGAPISLAPYGANGAYYAPQMDRVERIEVLKGSGSILYGPQTVGGVINYITKPIPDSPVIGYGVMYGSNNFQSVQLRAGGTWGHFGSDTHLTYKTGNGPRKDMDFSIYDFSQKFGVAINDVSDLEIKLHYYREVSNTSYLGLTTPMYKSDATQNPAKNDEFTVERFGLNLNHEYRGFDEALVNTSFYAYSIRRDWWRQDFDREDNADQAADGGFDGNTDNDGLAANGEAYERISGTGDNNGGSIFWKESNGGRNRTYKVVGIEPRAEYKNYKFGAKVHHEFEDNQRINGSSATSRSGVLRDDEDRSTSALATYGLAEYDITDKWRVMPGLRVEAYSQKREIFVKSEVERNLSKSTDMTVVLIPGLGTTYRLSDRSNVFGGVHRGFSPPSYSSAINNNGQDNKLDAEESWNYEMGIRHQFNDSVRFESAAFLYDYQNQIINASQSSGVDKANAKNTLSKGIEFGLSADNRNENGAGVSTKLGVTFLDSTFQNGVNKHKQLPYTPTNYANVGITFYDKNGHSLFLEGVFVGEMFTDNANTDTESTDGTVGKITSHAIANLTFVYQASESLNYFVAVKNMFNEKYIASRAPDGIFPGHEPQINIGLRKNL